MADTMSPPLALSALTARPRGAGGPMLGWHCGCRSLLADAPQARRAGADLASCRPSSYPPPRQVLESQGCTLSAAQAEALVAAAVAARAPSAAGRTLLQDASAELRTNSNDGEQSNGNSCDATGVHGPRDDPR